MYEVLETDQNAEINVYRGQATHKVPGQASNKLKKPSQKKKRGRAPNYKEKLMEEIKRQRARDQGSTVRLARFERTK